MGHKMGRAFWLLFSVVIFGASAFAGTKLKTLKKEPPKLHPDRGENIRSIMHYFYDRLVELRPILASELEFSNPKNKKTIRLVLSEIEQRLRNGKRKKVLMGKANQVTVELFQQHIAETRESFDLGEITRAYQGVRMATEFCIGCHTHLPQQGMPQLDWKKDILVRDPKNVRHTADFYFITRRYDYSLNIYDYLIREFPKSVVQEVDLRDIYRHKLLIFARIKRDPLAAVKSLGKDLKNQKLPVGVRHEVEVWKKSFAEWVAEKKKGLAPKGSQQRRKYVDRLLNKVKSYRGPSDSQPYLVPLLKSSGLLYEELFRSSKEVDKARNLYYLGKIERILGQSSFTLLGDLYLKECVRTAPDSKWAPRCLQEYKFYLKWRFPKDKKTPAHLKKELNELERLVNQAAGKGT